MDVLAKIKKLQKERGWSGTRLARESGLPLSTISSLFKRYNYPSLYTLEAICGAFGLTLSQFFQDGNLPAGLTTEQSSVLENWNRLGAEQKAAVLIILKSM